MDILIFAVAIFGVSFSFQFQPLFSLPSPRVSYVNKRADASHYTSKQLKLLRKPPVPAPDPHIALSLANYGLLSARLIRRHGEADGTAHYHPGHSHTRRLVETKQRSNYWKKTQIWSLFRKLCWKTMIFYSPINIICSKRLFFRILLLIRTQKLCFLDLPFRDVLNILLSKVNSVTLVKMKIC